MGSFLGHVFPGIFFIFFGLWWIHCTFLQFFRNYPKKFKSLPTFTLFEGHLKIFSCLVGILAETYTGFNLQTFSIESHNKQHILMYGFFLLNGLMDICAMMDQNQSNGPMEPGMMFYTQKAPLIPGLQRFSLIVALIAQLILFDNHLVGRNNLDKHVHILLLFCTFFAIIACLIEWMFADQPLAAILRGFTSMWMGLWFHQIAFILYNPFGTKSSWPTDGHQMYMNIATLFLQHAMACLLLIILMGYFYRKLYDPTRTQQIPIKENKHEIHKDVGVGTSYVDSFSKNSANHPC